MAGRGAPKGNTNGKRGKMARDMIHKFAVEDGARRLKAITAKLFEEAEAGNVIATKEIFDRLDGKVPLQVTGEDGGKIVIQVIR